MKIAIVHYHQLEMYPPVMNTIDILSPHSEAEVEVYTTVNNQKRVWFKPDSSRIKRIRVNASHPFFRTWGYVKFIVATLYWLIRYKPHRIVYYETVSFMPVYLYKKINSKVEIAVHHHEYVTKEEFEKGGKYVRFLEKLERKSYSNFIWISQTNDDRKRLFLEDYPFLAEEKVHAWPNFPLESWTASPSKSIHSRGKRIVYLGTLSVDKSYLVPLLEWLKLNPEYSLDIYTHGTTNEILTLLEPYKNVYYKGVVAYKELSQKLKKYDIGIVLYKTYILNNKYTIPNKVVEYLRCGLDVWCPHDIETTLKWTQHNDALLITTDIPDFMFGIDGSKINSKNLTAEAVFPYELFDLKNENRA